MLARYQTTRMLLNDSCLAFYYNTTGSDTSIAAKVISEVSHVHHYVMITSSNGNLSALLAICAGNSAVPGEFPAQRPVTRSFDVFFDLRPNKRLIKQW